MNDVTDLRLQEAARLHAAGQRLEAIAIFREVLAGRPDATEGWYELGYLLKAEGLYQEALDAYGEALARGIRRPEEVHLNRGVIYSDHLRRDDAAESELRAALVLAPAYMPALLNLGNLHEERGQRDAALAFYDQILALPETADGTYQDVRFEALARSANLRAPVGPDDPVLARLQHASVAASQHGKVARANLLFALGRAYEKLGDHAQAFDAFAKGNRCLLRQYGRTYDRAHAAALVDAMIAAFPTAAAPVATPSVGADAAPLFICGMFRSGSTLVEQVLAAHPRVIAGGELDFLMRLAAERLAPFPASVSQLDAHRDAQFAAEYRAHLRNLFPDQQPGTFITDKRPDNFQLIGLIKRMFPDARIVHTTRHPLDNGLSVYMQHLNLRVAGYSSDLGDIGHFYGQYRRLMTHWKSLYGDSIFDFDYDQFVRDPKATLLPLFDFLGLEWDDRCLSFHRLGNTVKTASYWQVRQPLYDSASGRWRHHPDRLGPLQATLREAGIRYDGDAT